MEARTTSISTIGFKKPNCISPHSLLLKSELICKLKGKIVLGLKNHAIKTLWLTGAFSIAAIFWRLVVNLRFWPGITNIYTEQNQRVFFVPIRWAPARRPREILLEFLKVIITTIGCLAPVSQWQTVATCVVWRNADRSSGEAFGRCLSVMQEENTLCKYKQLWRTT